MSPPRGPEDVVALALRNECPRCNVGTCGHEPGPFHRFDARRVLAALEAAGYGLTAPAARALDMTVEDLR